MIVLVDLADRSEDETFRHDVPERQHCRSAGAPHGGLWSVTSGVFSVRCPWRGGLRPLSDLGHFSVRCPWRGGLWSLSDLGRIDSPLPLVEDFSLWLTLDELTAPCPSRRSLSLWTGRTLVGLGRIDSPLPLAEVFVALDWSDIWLVNGRTHGRSRNARERFLR